jgi:hypothetical protein
LAKRHCKLAGLAAGVFLAVIVYQTHRVAPLGLIEISVPVVTVLCFVGTVAAGGLLSTGLEVPAFVGKLYQVLPVLTVLSTAGLLCLLLRRT